MINEGNGCLAGQSNCCQWFAHEHSLGLLVLLAATHGQNNYEGASGVQLAQGNGGTLTTMDVVSLVDSVCTECLEVESKLSVPVVYHCK